MNLHEVKNNQPDWQDVPKNEMNVFQQVAAATNGWGTVPNALDLASLILIRSANKDIRNKKMWKPLIKLTLSGSIDLVDGSIAELTKTKSPKGKIIDATTDKYRNIFTPMALTSENIIPKCIGYPVVASEVAIAIGAGAVYLSGNKEAIQASANGKKSKFELSLAIALHMLSKAVEKSGHTKMSKIALLGSSALYALSVKDAVKVVQDYAPRLLKKPNGNS